MKTFFLKLILTGLISSPAFVYADLVRFLPKDKEALQARVDLIQQAKKEIFAEYFAVTDDDTSTAGFALLRQAAQRGVKVHVIMDSLSNSVKREMIAALIESSKDAAGNRNLEIRVVNPGNPLDPRTLVQRDHAKMLNIDGEIMITGGRNVDNKYFGLDKKRNFVDLDIMIAGAAVASAKSYYTQLWNNIDEVQVPALYEHSSDRLTDECGLAENYSNCRALREAAQRDVAAATARLDEVMQDLASGRFEVTLNSGTNWLLGARQVQKAKFLSNSPNQRVGSGNQVVSDTLFKIVNGAERNVLILSPYLIPTERAHKMFIDLRSRQIPVKIITNSLKSTDNLFAQAGFRKSKAGMIGLGIELYEFNLVDTTHAKAAVVDDTIMIGTYNLDPRSAGLNREIGIVIENEPDLAQELRQIIGTFEKNSLLVGKNGQAQNTELQNQGVSQAKKILVEAVEKMALPFIYDQL